MKDFVGILLKVLTTSTALPGAGVSALLVVTLVGALLLLYMAIRPVAKALRIKITPAGARRVRRSVALGFLSGVAKATGGLAVAAMLWWFAECLS